MEWWRQLPQQAAASLSLPPVGLWQGGHLDVWVIAVHVLAVIGLWSVVSSVSIWWREVHLRNAVFRFVKALPVIGMLVQREKEKAKNSVSDMLREKVCIPDVPVFLQLPDAGLSPDDIDAIMDRIKQSEAAHTRGRAFGGIYYPPELDKLMSRVYARFASTNALYPAVFPGVRKFEAEVVAMSLALFNAPATGCGTMTSGGTESLLLAIKAYRECARAERGVRHPEMILGTTAHPALLKAAHYFGITPVIVRVNARQEVDPQQVRRHITRNTVAIVVSAPQFPHGVLDPIEDIGRIALQHRIPMHVDACFGGFQLAFLRRAGKLGGREFDFTVPGVTSLSADTHKYGLTQKGTSVILYRHPDLRRYQYFVATDWPGGLYCSPSVAGSRPGGIIAAAWASMVHLGMQGYTANALAVQDAFERLRDGVRRISGLYVVGEPVSCTVAVAARAPLSIYEVADALEAKGWSVSRLQRPECVHFVIGARQIAMIDDLLADLGRCVLEVRQAAAGRQGTPARGGAAVYGMAARLPDRGIVGEILSHYLDEVLRPEQRAGGGVPASAEAAAGLSVAAAAAAARAD